MVEIRPCGGCEFGAPFDGPYKGRGVQCTACWLWHKDPEHCKKIWGKEVLKAKATVNGGVYKERILDFAKAIAVETSWRVSGGRAPTDEEKAERREKCNSCRYRNPTTDVCMVCGCYLEAGMIPPRPIGKIGCSTQKCPLGPPLWNYVGGYVPGPDVKCCGDR